MLLQSYQPIIFQYSQQIKLYLDINIYIVSDWLLFNATSAIFQLYDGKNKLILYEMMMRSALY